MNLLKNSGYRGLSAIGLLAASFTGLSSAAEDPAVYSHVISPIFEAKCVGCHGADKQKGKLRMDTYAALIKGGSEGASLVPGNIADSLLVTRICLPADSDEHMPPEDKTQLTPAEVKLIRLWVEKGGTEAIKVSQLALPADLQATVAAISSSPKAPAAAPAKPAAPKVDPAVAAARKKAAEEVMKKINATGASLVPIAQDTPVLRFTALNVSDSFGDQQLAELAPIADQIAWLDIARTKVTDNGLAVVAKMTGLTKLHLENTSVGDAGMAHLAELKNLEYLNLYKTQVGDAGLEKLKGLTSLSKLYLWQSKASPAGAERLRSSVPKLVVNLGWEYESAKIAAIPAVATAKAPAPVPAAIPAPKPVAAAPAPAPAAADEYAGVRQRLTSAHQEALALLTKAKETVSRAENDVRVASNELNMARHHVEATVKGTAEATKKVAQMEAAVAAIQKALDSVKPHASLADVQKTLTGDLAKANKLVEEAKAKLAAARQAEQAAPAKATQAEANQVAKQKALDDARQRVPGYQAVANAIKQALDMVRL